MANRTTVDISLTPELGMFLHSRVKSGRYPTTSAAVREALRLLECQDTEIPAFRYRDTGILYTEPLG